MPWARSMDDSIRCNSSIFSLSLFYSLNLSVPPIVLSPFLSFLLMLSTRELSRETSLRVTRLSTLVIRDGLSAARQKDNWIKQARARWRANVGERERSDRP